MFLAKIVGFKHFDQKDDQGFITKKVRISFEDLESVADVGKLYSNISFKVDKIPEINDKCLGKEVIYDVGYFQNRPYGNKLIFK